MLAASLGGNEESQHRQERENGTLSTGVQSAVNVSVSGQVFLRIRRGRRRRWRRSNVSPAPMTSAGEVAVKSDSLTGTSGLAFQNIVFIVIQNMTSGY